MLSRELTQAPDLNCSSCQLQAHHFVCDEIATDVEPWVAICRERAQQHYQRLTRELTQGQLLRLGHRESFIQQASFVLLKGELYVRGETEGDSLSVFGFRVVLMLAGRHTSQASSTVSLRKRKEKFTLFSDHDGSLLRRQPGLFEVLKQRIHEQTDLEKQTLPDANSS